MAKYLKVTASGATRSGTYINWYVTFSVTDDEYYIQIRDDNGRTTSAGNYQTKTISDTVSGTIYSPGAGSKTTSAAYWYQSQPTGTLTYYEGLDATVSWGAMTLSVSFNANGGTTPTASKTVTYGSTYGTLPTPTRQGYEFLGWFTDASGGSQVMSSTTVSITANQILYAHWKVLSILHPVSGGTERTITNIKAVENGTVRNIISCYSVKDGVVRQGVK